jgi:hypothetical protein
LFVDFSFSWWCEEHWQTIQASGRKNAEASAIWWREFWGRRKWMQSEKWTQGNLYDSLAKVCKILGVWVSVWF